MKYSVVIPVYNEKDSIKEIFYSLNEVISNLNGKYELIFVDDGSSDNSFEELKDLASNSTCSLIVISLKKHCGQATALQAGFDISCGDVVITLDCDLQNDPKDIPKLLEKISEGYNVVFGWRCKRKDSFNKILQSLAANLLRRLITKDKVHDVGCPIKVIKKEVLKNIYLYSGLHRFLSCIVSRLNYKVTEVEVSHYPRKYGTSKYGFFDRFCEGLLDFLRIIFFDIKKVMKRFKSYEIREIIRK